MNKRRFAFSPWWVILVIVLVAVVAAGWVATGYLGHHARLEVIEENEASVATISVYMTSEFNKIEGAVKSLSGSPAISPALISHGTLVIENANRALDRYNSAINASVSYLMDANGMTLASSNRNDPDSFVGMAYPFRPYFQQAMKGHLGRYFAVGITSGKRGFYASFPVRDLKERIIGVVAMKKDLDEMEAFFTKYPYCFFITQEGIILLSSKKDMVLKSLWPVNAETTRTLMSSKQFGVKPFDAIFSEEIVDGTEVTLGDAAFIVSRKLIDAEGWSVILLASAERIKLYKATGIVTTIFILLFILTSSAIIYIINRSKQITKQSEERFRELFNNMSSGVVVYDATDDGQDFVIRDINRGGEQISNVKKDEIIGRSVLEVFPGVKEFGLFEMLQQVWKTGEAKRKDASLYKDDRISQWTDNYVYRLPSGEVVAVYDDISENKKAEEALQKSEERYREILHTIEETYVETDLAGKLTYFNPAACRMLGYSAEELQGMNYGKLMDEETRNKVTQVFGDIYQTGKGLNLFEYELIRKDRAKVFIESSVLLLKDAKGKPVGFRGIGRDISERKRFEEELRKLSISDQLTGLFNRRGFLALAEQQLKIAERTKIGILLLFADLDGLKRINDHLGHQKGDEALVEAATILKEVFRDSDIVARVGGDEFAVLALGTSMENSNIFEDRLQQYLSTHNAREGRDFNISMSIGMVNNDPALPCSIDELMSRADTLMYEQKKKKRAQRT